MAASEGTLLPSIQGTDEEEGAYSFNLTMNILTQNVLALEGLAALGVIESPDTFQTYTQLDGDLITLTLLPRARWQTLLNLDVISVRLFLHHLQKIDNGLVATQQAKGASQSP